MKPWALLLVPLSLAGAAATGTAMAVLVVAVHRSMIPDDAILAAWTRAGGCLMFVPLIFPALALGMILANLGAWCIPAARRSFESRSGSKSFKAAMKPLWWSAAVAVPVCLGVSLAGTTSYFHVADDGVRSRSFLSSERHDPWENVRAIHVRCIADGRNLHLNYRLEMKDGHSVDLMRESPLAFANAYPRIRPRLPENVRFLREIMPSGREKLKRRFKPESARKILAALEGATSSAPSRTAPDSP